MIKKLALQFPGITTGGIEEDFSDLDAKLHTWQLGTGPSGNPLNLADIINLLIPFIFVIAGLILLFMFIFGGFTIFTSAGNPEKIKQGQGTLTSALIGFLVIFVAYWIIQILELTFNLTIF